MILHTLITIPNIPQRLLNRYLRLYQDRHLTFLEVKRYVIKILAITIMI